MREDGSVWRWTAATGWRQAEPPGSRAPTEEAWIKADVLPLLEEATAAGRGTIAGSTFERRLRGMLTADVPRLQAVRGALARSAVPQSASLVRMIDETLSRLQAARGT